MLKDIIRQDNKVIFQNTKEFAFEGQILYSNGDIEPNVIIIPGDEGYGLNDSQQGLSDNATFYIDIQDIDEPQYNDKIIDENGKEWMVERIISREEKMILLSCRSQERVNFK